MERRELLQILATTSVAARSALAQSHGHDQPAARIDLTSYKPRLLLSGEYEFVEAFCGALIPADDESGGAIEAGVPYYLDTMLLHAKSPVQQQWRAGLAAASALVSERFGADFPSLKEDRREQVMLELLRNESNPQSETDRFIIRLKQSIVDAYGMSEVGLRHFGYAGNTSLTEFPGCTHPEHKS